VRLPVRRLAVTAVIVLSAACLAKASTADGAAHVKFGIKDDAWLIYGPGTLDSRVAELDRLGVDVVRFTLRWDAVATRRPARGADPNDPAYQWGPGDAVLKTLRQHGIAILLTLVGTPRWANGGQPPNRVPRVSSTFAAFASAAAKRYPYVRYWTIWNEPNQRLWLDPPVPRTYVVKLLNPAYAAIKRANPRALVAGGVTAPRGNTGGVSPLAWVKGMGKAGAKLDAYAHNPYPLLPQVETPSSGGCDHCETVTMATLERLIKAVKRWLGPKRIWLTEYGYQTNPPDRWLGVSWALQARYVAEAGLRVWRLPYVDMLINFLVRDDVSDSNGIQRGWQSGLYTVSGRAKPSSTAFMLPLAQMSRTGTQTTLWGQVRPRRGRQPYRLQQLRGGSWRWMGASRTTNADGTFVVTVQAPRGSLLRVWSPRDRMYGLVLIVR
jgi:hypothetical protein